MKKTCKPPTDINLQIINMLSEASKSNIGVISEASAMQHVFRHLFKVAGYYASDAMNKERTSLLDGGAGWSLKVLLQEAVSVAHMNQKFRIRHITSRCYRQGMLASIILPRKLRTIKLNYLDAEKCRSYNSSKTTLLDVIVLP